MNETSSKNEITSGIIWKQLLLFFFPILLGSFFQQLYNTIDAVIVGRFVGKNALAAVAGSSGMVINLLVNFFTGLTAGASVIVSQFFGSGDREKVDDSIHTIYAFSIIGSVIMTLIGITAAPALLRLMNTPEELMSDSILYLRIYFAGMIPSLIYNVGAGLLRAVGDSRRPLYFLISACMVNIVLDVLLVVGLEMGVAGAALATIFSQTVSAVLVVITLLRSHQVYRLEPRKIRFYGNLLDRIVRIGFPAGLQSVMYSLSNIIIQASINAFGTNVVAAYTAYGKLDGLYWMMINAFGVSITTFVGQNFGAGKYDRMRRSVRVCLLMTFGATVLMSGFFLLLGGQLYRLFTDDAEVIALGMQILRLLVPTYVTYICIEVLAGAMRGTGDSLIPTLFTLTGVCLLRVVWVMGVAPAYHSLTVVLLSYPITWTVTSVLFVIYYLKGGWLKRSIGKARLEA